MKHLDEHAVDRLARGDPSNLVLPEDARHGASCPECQARVEARRVALEWEETGATSGRPAAPLPPRELALQKGAVVGRYVVLDAVGEGGMGLVYAAYDPELSRKVALKLLRPTQIEGGDSSTGRARLIREAQAMAQLNHEHVVAVHDVGSFGDQVFLAMELVEGQSLRTWLREKPRPWREVLRVFREAGLGLMAAHQAGLVHRDFKPDNVLLTREGRAKVTDFGLARATGTVEPPAEASPTSASPRSSMAPALTPSQGMLAVQVTQAGVAVGTPAYMPPEQMRGQTPDAKGDVFSFAVALYEGLYGERPFAAKDLAELRLAIESGEVRPPAKGREVPAWLRRAVLRGLAAKGEARPTMEAFLKEVSPPQPRRLALTVVVATGVLAAVFVVASRRAQPPSPEIPGCEATSGLASWRETTRASLRAAFVATRAPQAEATADATIQALEDYVTKWTAGQRAACQRLGANAGDELGHAELTCLRDRKTEFEALVEVLGHPDAEIISSARPAVNSLLPPARCADVRVLAGLAKPPSDAAVRATVGALRIRLAGVNALRLATKVKEARAALEPLLEQAPSVGYRPFEAEVFLELAGLHRDEGRMAEAEEALSKAENIAEAAGADLIAAGAAAELAFVASYYTGHLEQGRRWLDRATALLTRVGGDPAIEAELELARSAIASLEGRDEDNLVHAQRSLDLRRQAFGAVHTLTVRAMNNIAATHAELRNWEESRKATEETLRVGASVFGARNPELGITTINLAETQLRLGDFEAADLTLRQAREMVTVDPGISSVWLSNLEGTTAYLRLGTGRLTEAVDAARLAMTYEEHAGGKETTIYAEALSSEGSALQRLGRAAAAIPVLERAIAIHEQTASPTTVFLVDPLVALSMARTDVGQPVQAILPAERAVEILTLHRGDPGHLASSRFALARALVAAHRDLPRAAQLASDAEAELASLPWMQHLSTQLAAWKRAHRLPAVSAPPRGKE